MPNQRACGASATSERTRPWNCGAYFNMCIYVLYVLMSLVCPIRMPAALRRHQEKHAPGFLVPCVFCRLVLLLAWCAQSACLRRFANLRKNTPLEFWSKYLVYFVDFCHFQLGVPNQRACGASATSETTRPWMFGACFNMFIYFLICL